MIDTYLNDQNISNNIIIKKSDVKNNQKRIIISSEKSMSYSSSVDDKNETIDNQINDSTSSFDYSDTLRVSEIPKKEKKEKKLEKSRNFLDYLTNAISENFHFFNKPRKTQINNSINIEKNKKISNLSFKEKINGNKLEERIKKNKLGSSGESKNFIINRIKASKSLNDKSIKNVQNKKEIKNNYLSNKENIKTKDNNDKNINGKINIRNKNNKICNNININLSSKNPKNLTNSSISKMINIKEKTKLSNDINNSNNSNITKKRTNPQDKPKNKINDNSLVIANKSENIKNLKNNFQCQQHPRLTCIETDTIKNTNITPRLTVPLNFFRENISTQNIFQKNNKNKKINLDINHKLSKSPKNVIVKKLYPLNGTNNIFVNKDSLSPKIKNNLMNNKNLLTYNENNICKVQKISDNFDLDLKSINNKSQNNNYNKQLIIHNTTALNMKNNINIINNRNNHISQNHLTNILPQEKRTSIPITSQKRMTISTNIINNTLPQQPQQPQQNTTNNVNSLYSPRLTNIQNQMQPQNILNQISFNSLVNNSYNNYIISDIPYSTTKKNINITYDSFDSSGYLRNYGILTLPGKDTSGLQKTNQDSYTFFSNINGLKNFNIFGVLDGHGIEGHFVSKFASKYIPYQIMNNPEIKNLKDTEMIYNKLKYNNYQIIIKSYLDCDIALHKVNFDSKESGSTCNLIINIGNHIICANTGDSRSILVFDENNKYKCIPLSIDFKPEMPEEMNRIILSGGEVRQIKNEIGEGVGPYRVWKRGEGYPGLAMSRSIGDLNGKKIGVIPNPGIIEYQLNEKSKYIVVCSDGVWEFLNNENVKEIGNKYYLENNPSGFCHELVNTAFSLWEKNDIVIDDITAVVAFF